MEGQRDRAAQAAYYALFKVVSIADLEGADKAVEWAESTLENEGLLRGLAEGMDEAAAAREEQDPPT